MEEVTLKPQYAQAAANALQSSIDDTQEYLDDNPDAPMGEELQWMVTIQQRALESIEEQLD